MGDYRFDLPWRFLLYSLIILSLSLFYHSAVAQTTLIKNSGYTAKPDTIEQVDVADVLKHLFKLKINTKYDTIKVPPGKLLFSFVPTIAYSLELGASVSLAENISFYTGNLANTNLSVINVGMQYSVHKQFVFPIISEIWTNNNKYCLLGDWRYYKYPSYTFGLGGAGTSAFVSDNVDYSYFRFYQEILRHFHSYYYVGFGYNFDYHYNIVDNAPVTDYPEYNGTATLTKSSGPVFHFMYDSRKNINNPQAAFYGSVLYRYNTTSLGSDNNWQEVQVEARKYFKLSAHKILAFWSWNEFTFDGRAPYFDLPSNGWDTYANTGRGYIQSRFRGPDMVYGEAELRFGILRNGLLGGVVFTNATSVTNWPDVKFTEAFPAGGAGLRVKFNKYSNVNVCIDYAIGIEGSKGFFFNLGEVF